MIGAHQVQVQVQVQVQAHHLLRRRLLSTSPSPTSAPYPFPLFWTKSPTTTSLALSFTKFSSPPSSTDKRVVGWIKTQLPPTAKPVPTTTNFEPNLKFEEVLHQVLNESIHEDEGLQQLAFNQKEGYLNVSDTRVYTPWGRVSDPEDLIGAVLLKEGKIVPGTFQPTGTHRIVSMNGLFCLSETLTGKLVEKLSKIQG